MIDRTLIDKLTEMANKEKKIKEFKKRLRVKGKVAAKGTTKKGNITLTIEKNDERYKFTILKSHKERYDLAEKLQEGRSVSAEGIPKFRVVICTRLKLLEKGIGRGRQEKIKIY